MEIAGVVVGEAGDFAGTTDGGVGAGETGYGLDGKGGVVHSELRILCSLSNV